jgi:hypothetical protein
MESRRGPLIAASLGFADIGPEMSVLLRLRWLVGCLVYSDLLPSATTVSSSLPARESWVPAEFPIWSVQFNSCFGKFSVKIVPRAVAFPLASEYRSIFRLRAPQTVVRFTIKNPGEGRK